MNKKILTAAIGAAMIAGPLAAQADLKISGRVALEGVSEGGKINAADYGNTRLQFDWSEGNYFGRYALDMRQSKLTGVSGTATTGTYPFPVSGSTSAYRDYYAGVKGDWGSFRAGRLAGAGKNIEKDRFVGTFLELRNAFVKGKSYGSSSFINNMVQYDNKFGDTKLVIQYDPTDNGGKKGDTGVSIKAKAGGANLFGAWNNEGNVNGEGYYKIGGSMKFGDIKPMAIYQTDTTGGTAVSSYVIGAEMAMGDWMVDVTWTDKGEMASKAGYRVGAYRKMNKKAHVWVGLTDNGSSSSSSASVQAYGVGLRVDI